MAQIDFSSLRRTRKPTKKERGRYRRWVEYLSDSRLSEAEVHNRAAQLTAQGKEPRP